MNRFDLYSVKKSKAKNSKEELQVQVAVCDYIRLRYPGIIFESSLAGINMTIGQRVQIARTRSGSYPDLCIDEARGGYFGLRIEIKKLGESISKKDGSYKSTHLINQSKIIDALKLNGYFSGFFFGIDECIKVVDWYMSNPKTIIMSRAEFAQIK
jgi:hypothetical protein